MTCRNKSPGPQNLNTLEMSGDGTRGFTCRLSCIAGKESGAGEGWGERGRGMVGDCGMGNRGWEGVGERCGGGEKGGGERGESEREREAGKRGREIRKNECCFYATILHSKAILGRG